MASLLAFKADSVMTGPAKPIVSLARAEPVERANARTQTSLGVIGSSPVNGSRLGGRDCSCHRKTLGAGRQASVKQAPEERENSVNSARPSTDRDLHVGRRQ